MQTIEKLSNLRQLASFAIACLTILFTIKHASCIQWGYQVENGIKITQIFSSYFFSKMDSNQDREHLFGMAAVLPECDNLQLTSQKAGNGKKNDIWIL